MNAIPPSSLPSASPSGRSAGSAGRCALRRARAAAALGLGLATLALPGCDRVTPAALGGGYPSLGTVPPRPQLSYTVPQREAVALGLIHDRENARYTDRVVRYRAGLTDEPPPAPPPPPVTRPAPAAAEPPAPPPQLADPALALPPPPSVSDDGSLDDFIRGLVRETETRTAPEPSPPAPAVPVAPAGEATGEPQAMVADPPPVEAAAAGGALAAASPRTALPAPKALFPAPHGETPAKRPLAWLAARLGSWFGTPSGPSETTTVARPDHHHPALVPVAVTDPEQLGLVARAAAATGRMPPGATAADRSEAAPMTLAGATRPAPEGLGPSVGAGLVDLGDAAGRGAVRPPPGVALGVVGFAADSAALPRDAAAMLRRAAALAGADRRRSRVRVVGYAADPALAAERAAAVGLTLVGLGVAAGDLRLAVEASGGSADEARVFLAAGDVR